MNNKSELAKRFREVILNGTWIANTNFKNELDNSDWKIFLYKFWRDSEEFAQLIEKMDDDKLSEHFVEEKYGTYQRNIDAMIEHSYYHLGQIVLIKKILKIRIKKYCS